MELYTFTDTANEYGVLRVKSDYAVELLPGFHRILETMQDCDITHAFTLVEKMKEEVVSGYHYAWYKITGYVQNVDKAAAVARRADNTAQTNSIVFVTLAESGAIDEVTAAEHAELFAPWAIDVEYKAGSIHSFGDCLYKCLQAHKSQEGWEPDKAASLWKKIGDPTVEYPEWSQPVGAGDGYEYGAKVSHMNKHWHSEFNGENIWEPGAAGTEALWVEDA